MKVCYIILCSFLFFQADAQQTAVPASIYDFSVPALNGGTIDLAQYKGKMILIVNTPSEAFYDRRYAELEAFYKQHKDKVVVIGFLDDDFGLPPGAGKSIPIDERNYNVSFPLAAKIYVKSDKMAPIYQWLTEEKYNHLKDSEVKWDFQKYLINEQGKLVAVFDPKVKANSPQILSAIEK